MAGYLRVLGLFAIIYIGSRSRSITVSTTGFHPVNRSSTLLEITICESESEFDSFFVANYSIKWA